MSRGAMIPTGRVRANIFGRTLGNCTGCMWERVFGRIRKGRSEPSWPCVSSRQRSLDSLPMEVAREVVPVIIRMQSDWQAGALPVFFVFDPAAGSGTVRNGTPVRETAEWEQKISK